MQPDPAVDFDRLHTCHLCHTQLWLASLPVSEGWVVGTRCECRDRVGGPLRYSSDSTPFPTFNTAEDHRKTLLGETTWV